jgi:uncharacterized protein
MMGTFFAVAALLSWAPLALVVSGGFDTGIGRFVSIFYSFGPLVAALVVQGPLLRGEVLEPLGIGRDVNRFWLVAWLAPVLVLAIALLATWLIEGVAPTLTVDGVIANKRTMVPLEHMAQFEARLREGRPPHPFFLVLGALPAGLVFNIVPAFAEEVGFRGFLYRELPGGYFARAIRIGLVSFVWSLPALALGIWYRDHIALGLAAGLVFHVAFSLASVYVRVRSGSVIACALMRATIASLVSIAFDASFGASDIVRPMYGISGSVGLLALVGLFLVHDRFFATKKLVFGAALKPGTRSSPPAAA